MSRRPITMSLAEVLNLGARARGQVSLIEMRDNPAQRGKRGQKYGNTKVQADGITFDSKAEHRRWCHLRVLERAGEIRDLRLQVPFELIPAQVSTTGKKQRATVYLADFVYARTKDGKVVVEDVKGAVTPEFRLKRKLMLERHGIEIQEIRS
ncbi:DUF1064 domain-containing protein [Roseateles chitosanitabidus]|uniref:DUF1064 domain-containing protein n=1 Tax=Roseateles chitosanitabidus TaxID=65048 RepID=UPI001FE222A7|nr:DUF1064 domain-containing protein [Roseateles chitosanitabidus]